MVHLLYNLVLLTGLIVALPGLLVKALLDPAWRARLRRRLDYDPAVQGEAGRPVAADLPAENELRQGGPSPLARPRVIWIHALSVGETASVVALVRALRREYPAVRLVFSSTTRAGEEFAVRRLGDLVDYRLVLPFDLPWLTRRLVRRLRPDLFILVESDFWPNLLRALRAEKVPALLVNGRISAVSFKWYGRLACLFRPLFLSFASLAMQTAADAARLARLNLAPPERVVTPGNLKYAAALENVTYGVKDRAALGIAPQQLVWVAGSTHDGEEEIILATYRRLRAAHPELLLVLAPRRLERAEEVANLARANGLRVGLRSRGPLAGGEEVLILDTYGELAACYAIADLALVGGSLVAAGGHNPLEPAVFAKPVLFGPHMEDFAEISRDLLAAGGAAQVAGEEELCSLLAVWLDSAAIRQETGGRGRALVEEKADGVIRGHLRTIATLLANRDQERMEPGRPPKRPPGKSAQWEKQ